ncbi:amino acid adenylation domain-containing protein [Streptomyces sp. NPDC005438]|uniref:amino acid adenylation domain-containing protein n=1 Tax=Streptomyces sp. NPDC005438 TaxID=3156880 RepID=UPI0033BB7A6A
MNDHPSATAGRTPGADSAGHEPAAACVAQYVQFNGPMDLESLRRAIHGALRERPLPRSGSAVPTVEEREIADADPVTWVTRELAGGPGGSTGQRHVLLRCADGRIGWYQQVHPQRSTGTAHPARPAGDGLTALTALVRRAGDLYGQLTASPDGSAVRTTSQALAGLRPEPGGGTARPDQDASAKDRDFWRQQLVGAPVPWVDDHRGLDTSPDLNAMRPGPPRNRGWLPVPDDHATLPALARRSGGGPAAVVLAALAVYAHRLSGDTELLIGYGSEHGVLPVRVTVSPGTSFAQLVRRVGLTLRRARRHTYVPEEDQPWGTARHYGAIALLADSGDRVPFGAARATVEHAWDGATPRLCLRVDDLAADGWALDLAGPRADRAQQRRLVDLLRRLAAQPRLPVGRFDLANEEELRQLAEWNATDRPLGGPEKTLPAAFAARVAEHPTHIAVRDAYRELSYAELDTRAERIARLLARRGVGPEDVVALLLPRTTAIAVGVIGVLKSGAAYLPVDPDYPAGRIAYLFTDARPKTVLTTSDLVGKLPPDAPEPILLDEITDQAPTGEAWEPAGPTDPGNAAYHIYTSGSTGHPKGVVVTHRSVLNLIHWAVEEFGAAAFSRVLSTTSLSFDPSVQEVLIPLLSGGSVDFVRNLVSLLDRPDWSGSLINTVPSVYRRVSEAEWVADRAQHYLFMGEPLPGDLVREIHRRDPSKTVTNMYGPTEATVNVTSWRCDPERPEDPPIGVPIANVRCHVLDAALRPVPPGRHGELYLAGECLARGYAHRFALTAERFVADPFGGPGARMYRTGDLVHWDHDGRLHFATRADHQIKVRGIRVEPGEIETRLASLPQVAAAAVVAVSDEDGDRRLAAYVEAAAGATPDAGELRAELRRQLPEALVPTVIETVDALPGDANGKTDRRTLAEWANRSARTVTEAAPDTTGRNEGRVHTLRQVFAGVLGLAEVGPEDNFFALGGDSINSIKLIRRAHRAGLAILVEDVFEHPTPVTLAEKATPVPGPGDGSERGGGQAVEPREPAVPERRGQRYGDQLLTRLNDEERSWLTSRYPAFKEVLPLSPMQEGFLFHRQFERNTEDAYVMLLFLNLTGSLDSASLSYAVRELGRRHPNLCAGFVVLPSGRSVQVYPRRDLECREVDLSGLSPQEQGAELARLDTEGRTTRFDPADPPLIRFTLVRLGADRFQLRVVAHHILLDGWSNHLFLPELFALYWDPDSLPEPTPYADYLRWVERQDKDAALRAWCDSLAGAVEPTLVAPPGKNLSTPWPARIVHHLTLEESAAVSAAVAAHGVTVNTLLQCCWALMLAEHTGRWDVFFGVTVSGRSPDLDAVESIIGLLINTLPMRVTLSAYEPFAALLRRVQRERAALLPHQHVGLAEIQRAAGVGELFDTSLVFENFPQADAKAHANLGDLNLVSANGMTAGHYPLGMMAFPGNEQSGIELDMMYRTDVFDEPGAQRLLDRLLRLIRTFVADPDLSVAQLDLLDAQEHARLAECRSSRERVAPATLPTLLEAQALRSPSAVALRVVGTGSPGETGEGAADGGLPHEIDYAQLDARVNQLARELIARGVASEDHVAVLLPRSVAEVVAFLGVLKAGAAFVPLDPRYPEDRVRLILEDARPRLVLTDSDHASLPLLRERADLLVVDEETTIERVAAHPESAVTDADRGTPLLPDHVAYVIYTSGSTGRPKGVLVQHSGMAGVLASTPPMIGLGEGSRVPHVLSPAFDVGVYEVLETLACGATLVLAPSERVMPGRALEELVRRERVTAMTLTPSALAVLEPGELPSTTVVRVIGEVLLPELARRWSARHTLVNSYGPTEATVMCTATAPLSQAAAPIGRPLANVTVHLLDDALRPVAPEHAGEVYLAGPVVARGYVGQPGLTAHRFVADPFVADGTRMYRTGDLARWNRDGELEFVGRVDRQLKVRGFRLEPGETESALLRLDGVAEVAVRGHADDSGGTRLVAYVVPGPSAGDSPEASGSSRQPVGGADLTAFEEAKLEEWRAYYDDVVFASDRTGDHADRDRPVETGTERDGGAPSSPADTTERWSVFDGTPVPYAELLQARDATVARLRELQPRRVLEIGAGDGLLLAALAPHCEVYQATDLSSAAVHAIQRDLERSPLEGADIRVRQQPAHDFHGFRAGEFDTIVLNSVAQYFPSEGYLRRVLAGALELLAPGGTLFLGDLRDPRLNPCRYTAAECATVSPASPVSQVRLVAGRRTLLDEQLAIDPAFFATLEVACDLRLRAGCRGNELTRYRYDAVLHKDSARARTVTEASRLTWGSDIRNQEELVALLRSVGAPVAVRVRGVPDARLVDDLALWRAVEDAGGGATVGRLAPEAAPFAVDPDQLAESVEPLGYASVAVPTTAPGTFDAVLIPLSEYDGGRFRDLRQVTDTSGEARPLVHDSTSADAVARLPGALLQRLRRVLPDHAVPSAVTVLSRLPRTPNGKIDENALPDPDAVGRTTGRAPQNETERQLCALFAEMLGLEEVGADDNFFDLGGHSLLATRLVRRVEHLFGGELDTATLFGAPTPAELAERIGESEQGLALEPVLPLRSAGGRPPLFCVHPGTGIGWKYAGLMRHLDGEVPLYALQARGLNGQGELPDSIEAMAADYVEQLRGIQPEGPYRLLGWSLGGVIAHAMAVLLEEQGQSVSLLAMLDSYASTEDAVPCDAAGQPVHGAGAGLYLALLDHEGVGCPESGDGALTAHGVLELLRHHGSPLGELSAQDLMGMATVHENNLRLVSTYRPGHYSGDVLFVEASQETADEGSTAGTVSTAAGWGAYVGGDLRVRPSGFRHDDLAGAEAFAEIGPVVADELRFLDGRKGQGPDGQGWAVAGPLGVHHG